MIDYYLRCRASAYPTLVSRGVRMGVITDVDGVVAPVGAGAWDYIGEKFSEDGQPVGGAADPYVHINFRTEHNLRERAMAEAQAGDVDIASGMAEIADYFIIGADGQLTAPAVPMRIFL